jgi:subtilase family serine protease
MLLVLLSAITKRSARNHPEALGIVFCLLLAALLVSPCSALYDFDGFPLKSVSQGQVNGQVFQYTILGLQNSPRTLEFEIPADAEIQWARTYAGVWGGTPRYTGWVDVSVNGQDFGKVTLYGQDDKTPNVYCTGYGVYWTAWDSTAKVKTGKNTVVVTTSQGLPESKLDGRIYGVTTVIVAKTPGGADTRYWILEGNTNLHGEGWTAGANPTVNDATSATIAIPDLSGSPHANLSIIELTSTRGLPDYVQFNGRDLGSPATDAAMNYAPGAYDIADEMSYDNGYPGPDGKTIMGRYWDSEIFDVTSQVKQGNNDLKFLRGKDLNGDGTISSNSEPYEGEDYLHPVFALLTLERPRAAAAGSAASSGSGTDLAIGKVEVVNAFNGETATIAATLQNLGTRPASAVPVSFSVDETVIGTQQVTVDASGVQQVSFSWPATAGTHSVTAEVKAVGDTVASNNAVTRSVTVGSLPDLEVSIGSPKSPGGSSDQQKSPLPPAVIVMAVFLAAGSCHILRKRRTDAGYRMFSALFALLVLAACLFPLIPAAAASATTKLYLVPVAVKNIGGSDAPAFTITIYLDGEKIATKAFDDGLAAGTDVSADIPINTVPGSHTLKVVADETAAIRDGNRANNAAESAYVFP